MVWWAFLSNFGTNFVSFLSTFLSFIDAATSLRFRRKPVILKKNHHKNKNLLNRHQAINFQKLKTATIAKEVEEEEEEEEYAVAIIGSGLSALVCGALLAKSGKRIIILEKHPTTVGGCTHLFNHQDWSFKSGIHYVGERTGVEKLLQTLTLPSQPPISWLPLGTATDQFTYDVIFVDGQRYEFPAGKQNWLLKMKTYFPDEAQILDRYVALCEKVTTSDTLFFKLKLLNAHQPALSWLRKKCKSFFCKTTIEYMEKTSTAVLTQELNASPRLQAVLTGQFLDMGLEAHELPFYLLASVFLHYIEGAALPLSDNNTPKNAASVDSAFVQRLVPFILQQDVGNRIFYNAEVSEIVIENHKAIGVCVKNKLIRARKIISSCGLNITVKQLVKPEHWSQPTRQKLNLLVDQLGSSISYGSLFLGLDLELISDDLLQQIPPRDIQPPNYNHWFIATPSSSLTSFSGGGGATTLENWCLNSPPSCFIGFDQNKIVGKVSVTIMCPIDPKWFVDDDGDNNNNNSRDKEGRPQSRRPQRRRSIRYKERKKQLEAFLLQVFRERFPQYYDRIAWKEAGTSLTNKTYMSSWRGESYGIKSTAARFLEYDECLSPHTEIQNLLLTGQDITTLGLSGALWSGYMTAHLVDSVDFFFLLLGWDLTCSPHHFATLLKKKKILLGFLCILILLTYVMMN